MVELRRETKDKLDDLLENVAWKRGVAVKQKFELEEYNSVDFRVIKKSGMDCVNDVVFETRFIKVRVAPFLQRRAERRPELRAAFHDVLQEALDAVDDRLALHLPPPPTSRYNFRSAPRSCGVVCS